MINWFKKKSVPVVQVKDVKPSTVRRVDDTRVRYKEAADVIINDVISKGLAPYNSGAAASGGVMDNQLNTKNMGAGGYPINEAQLYWYASQSFIGFQQCAILSQNWLIKKCCNLPAQDAVRNGYDLTFNDGEEVDQKIIAEIRKLDKKFKITKNLIEFVDLGRVFGIRVALFEVDSDDPDYYYKPFNIDGVTPGSYRGISQIDPYFLAPQLSARDSADFSAINFYEPTWWNVSGKLIHRSHLVIFRTETLPDILKPAYVYAGVSIPQKIFHRVYCAEKTADEAPLLAMTKRTDVIKTDLSQALSKEDSFYGRIASWVSERDNFGIKVIDKENEDVVEFDTSLADLDAVIMTSYQLVAAQAGIPSVKLLGTSPKGFNTSGEYEESSYHEFLESTQENDLTPFLDRHYACLIKSYIDPKFKTNNTTVETCWRPLDAVTGKEQAEIGLIKAQTGAVLSQSGAISGGDERARVIAEKDSGYNGLDIADVPEETLEGFNFGSTADE